MKIKKIITLIVYILFFLQTYGQKKHALLIGINTYSVLGTTPSVYTNTRNIEMDYNLSGCLNDIMAISQVLVSKYNFDPSNISKLTNYNATRKSILRALDSLESVIMKGDIVVFYYSGHGSQVVNSSAKDGTGIDQTIVPSDFYDIRNKELALIFDRIATNLGSEGKLTLIFDSCHSGAITRGKTGIETNKSRNIPPINFDFNDSTIPPILEKKGVLIMSASQRDQKANEIVDSYGNIYGAFSHSLLRSLYSSSINEPLDRLLLRVNSMIKVLNKFQDPVFSANQKRLKLNFIGMNSEENSNKVFLAITKIGSNKEIFLSGGLELGLHEGATLKSTDKSKLIVIEETPQIAMCKGELKNGEILDLKIGDVLEVVSYGNTPATKLKIFFENSIINEDDLKFFKNEILQLTKSKYITSAINPEKKRVDYLIRVQNNKWQIIKKDKIIFENRKQLDSKTIIAKIPKGSNVLTLLPLSKNFISNLLSALNPRYNIEFTSNEYDADYNLMATIRNDTINYLLQKAEMSYSNNGDIFPTVIEIYNEYDDCINLIIGKMIRLGKIKTWMNLESPPVENDFFPYLLGIKRNSNNEIILTKTEVFENEKMTLVLVADSVSMKNWNGTKKYCYIFVIDSNGDNILLYPDIDNHLNEMLPRESFKSELIESLDVNFSISGPFGYDTFYCLVTENAIYDMSIFEIGNNTKRGEEMIEFNPTKIFNNLNTKTRGSTDKSTNIWAIQKLIIESKPQK